MCCTVIALLIAAHLSSEFPVSQTTSVADLISRARGAQLIANTWTQQQADDAVAAAAWAIVEPERNRRLAELAVASTGLGAVDDKVQKNYRKTLGLLRDLHGAKSVGIIEEDSARGLTTIARPVGVVAAITPSTNPAATPANKLINALKTRNAVVLAPSPKGLKTATLLVEFVHAELRKIGAPLDLVQVLSPAGGRAALHELMRAADLVVATGSSANVRAAYESGTPALGVGAGNVAGIVLPAADLALAAARIVTSKTFDNATSCSSENSLVVVGDAWPALLAELERRGAVLLTHDEAQQLQHAMFPGGKLAGAFIAQPAARIAALAGLTRGAVLNAHVLLVSPQGVGAAHPFSGEKLSPVLALYRVADFNAALTQVQAIYDYQGKGHSVGVHGASPDEALQLGLRLPVCRVIVDQVHSYAVGGAFNNGLPFSLSMGCGTWGGNGFSDNLNYRHFLNLTRIVRPIAEQIPTEEQLLGDYWERFAK